MFSQNVHCRMGWQGGRAAARRIAWNRTNSLSPYAHSADNITATYPTRLNFGLQSYRGNYVIHIQQIRPAGWKKSSYQFGPMTSGNYYNGTRLDNVFWRKAGFVIIVR